MMMKESPHEGYFAHIVTAIVLGLNSHIYELFYGLSPVCFG